MGLYLAGYDVTGVDVKWQPRYPAFHSLKHYSAHFEFVQADALAYPLEGFDFIWASPPCQKYSVSAYNSRAAGVEYPDLIAPIRERLEHAGVPYCIENVPGAPLRTTITLNGWMFPDLRVVRKRIFETNFFVMHPPNKPPANLIAKGYSCVVGGGRCSGAPLESNAWHTHAAKLSAMGVDWKMNRHELAQAVPPRYAEWIANAFLQSANTGSKSDRGETL